MSDDMTTEQPQPESPKQPGEGVPRAQPKLPVAVGVPVNGLDEAFRMAQALALSELVPKSMRGKPPNVLAAVLYGAELGIGAMQAIHNIAPVNGAPVLKARLWIALLRRAGHRVEKLDAQSLVSCTVRITRGDTGEQHTETFTVDQAIRAGLVSRRADGTLEARSEFGKPLPWELYTDDMLLARAVSRAAGFLCPEVALGFAAEGELVPEDPQPEPPPPTRAEARQVDPQALADEVAAVEAEFYDTPSAAQSREDSSALFEPGEAEQP